MFDEFSESPLRFSCAQKVAAALAEVLPSDRYRVLAAPGLGYGGLRIDPLFVEPGDFEPHWYFDNTYGGDDGYSSHLRVYFTSPSCEFFDDPAPSDAPAADADPVTIARWVASVVARGVPSSPLE